MKCFYCNAEVRWNNDFDAEDVNSESEYIIVSKRIYTRNKHKR